MSRIARVAGYVVLGVVIGILSAAVYFFNGSSSTSLAYALLTAFVSAVLGAFVVSLFGWSRSES